MLVIWVIWNRVEIRCEIVKGSSMMQRGFFDR